MSRALDLFKTIKKQGLESIDSFIFNRQSEEQFLDFKRSADHGNGNKLNNSDRENLSKAISGFGNSEGGIIIWGVDCSRCQDGADVANAKMPITNVKRYLSWLENAISGCTIPPHTGVENFAILEDSSGNGFVVTYIPKSLNTPHQTVGSSRYYIRAGSNFVPTPHAVLAVQFGRRSQPDIIHQYLIEPFRKVDNSIFITFSFVIKNIGQSIAKDTYFNAIFWGKPSRESTIAFNILDEKNWEGHFALGINISLITKSGVRLVPQFFFTPLNIKLNLIPPFTEDFRIEFNYGCENGMPKTYRVEKSIAYLNELLYEVNKNARTNSLKRLEDSFLDDNAS